MFFCIAAYARVEVTMSESCARVANAKILRLLPLMNQLLSDQFSLTRVILNEVKDPSILPVVAGALRVFAHDASQIRGSFPFGFAQGQDDGVKQAKASASVERCASPPVGRSGALRMGHPDG